MKQEVCRGATNRLARDRLSGDRVARDGVVAVVAVAVGVVPERGVDGQRDGEGRHGGGDVSSVPSMRMRGLGLRRRRVQRGPRLRMVGVLLGQWRRWFHRERLGRYISGMIEDKKEVELHTG